MNQQTDAIYDLIVAAFSELGATNTKAVRRTILVRDNRFVGQRFCCGDLQAILLDDGSPIECYGPGGQLLKTVILPETAAKAA